jgi:hypothetical protein
VSRAGAPDYLIAPASRSRCQIDLTTTCADAEATRADLFYLGTGHRPDLPGARGRLRK